MTASTGAPDGVGDRAETTAGRAPGGDAAATSADGAARASRRRAVPGRVATRERRSDREGIGNSLVARADSPRIGGAAGQALVVPDEVSSCSVAAGLCLRRAFLR